jgi:hypothetical protein
LHFADGHVMIGTEEEIIDVHWWLRICSQIKLVLSVSVVHTSYQYQPDPYL